LGANGDGDANQQLIQTFRFLGGTYVPADPHAILVIDEAPPAADDAPGRWQWISRQARAGRKQAEALWPSIIDPPS